MNPRLATNLALVAVMAVLALSSQIQPTWARTGSVFDDIELFVNVRHDLMSEYVTTPDDQALIEGGVRGMIDALNDPYTVYLSSEELSEFNKSMSGSFSGIGAEVRINPDRDRIEIVTPLEDSPAWNAGVLAGDLILQIDGEDTEGMNLNAAVGKLTGKKGTDVTIRVRHTDGEEEDITITRDRIVVSTVRGFTRDANQAFQFWINPADRIGYVRLTQFNQNSVEELGEVLESLVAEDMAGLIFDLRFNPGGLLPAAETVSDMFLEPGKSIVSVEGRTVPKRTYSAKFPPLVPRETPVVILANGASASAAEIVTGALKENDRAFVVGTRTFGKGSVQQLKNISRELGALKITNAYYYLPSGRNIHRLPILAEDDDVEKTWGVDPSDDAYVPMTTDEFRAMREARQDLDNVALREAAESQAVTPDYVRENLSDPQLAAALEAITAKIAGQPWPAVGQDGAEAILAKQEREALEEAIGRLEEQLDEVRAELAKLDVPKLEAGDLEVFPPELVEDGVLEAIGEADAGLTPVDGEDATGGEAPAANGDADATPADATPADATPADATPADADPADATPAETTPAETAPLEDSREPIEVP